MDEWMNGWMSVPKCKDLGIVLTGKGRGGRVGG